MIGMGSKVVMNDKGRYKVSKEDEGKVFEVRSEPFEICGAKCVLLKGKRGGYAIDALTEVETEKEIAGKWIPCSERLPEEGVDVLVWFQYFRYGNYNRLFQTTGISFTHNGKWSGFVNGQSGWNQLSIIAWQPLPEPYQPKGE